MTWCKSFHFFKLFSIYNWLLELQAPPFLPYKRWGAVEQRVQGWPTLNAALQDQVEPLTTNYYLGLNSDSFEKFNFIWQQEHAQLKESISHFSSQSDFKEETFPTGQLLHNPKAAFFRGGWSASDTLLD